MPYHPSLYLLLCVLLLASGCKKDTELIPHNDPPYYSEVSDLLIENYINRVYIDQIGREPLDLEMVSELMALKKAHLSMASRQSMILKLQSDTSYVAGDISYKRAYYHRVYEQCKARFMEAASDAEIHEVMGPIASGILPDSLNGNWESVADRHARVRQLQAVLSSQQQYYQAEIGIDRMCAYMINNAVFDQINMNTFNFVNASFDNLFFRYPTQTEFFAGFNMVEYNQPGTLLGSSGQNKNEFIDILVSSREFYTSLILWSYQVLLAREPSTAETNNLMMDLWHDHDLQRVQRTIMMTDEYAHFEK